MSLRDRLALLGAGLPSVLNATVPLFGALVAFAWLRERLSAARALGVAAGSMLGASALLVPPALFLLPAELPGPRALGAGLLLGVVCTSLAYALYFRLLEALGATRAITVTYLIPCFGLLWGTLFLAEPLTSRTLLGSAVVLAGTALVLRAGAAQPAPKPASPAESCPSSPPRTAP